MLSMKSMIVENAENIAYHLNKFHDLGENTWTHTGTEVLEYTIWLWLRGN